MRQLCSRARYVSEINKFANNFNKARYPLQRYEYTHCVLNRYNYIEKSAIEISGRVLRDNTAREICAAPLSRHPIFARLLFCLEKQVKARDVVPFPLSPSLSHFLSPRHITLAHVSQRNIRARARVQMFRSFSPFCAACIRRCLYVLRVCERRFFPFSRPLSLSFPFSLARVRTSGLVFPRLDSHLPVARACERESAESVRPLNFSE